MRVKLSKSLTGGTTPFGWCWEKERKSKTKDKKQAIPHDITQPSVKWPHFNHTDFRSLMGKRVYFTNGETKAESNEISKNHS